MRCGHDLIIGGNFMLSDICGEELNEDDDAMVTNANVRNAANKVANFSYNPNTDVVYQSYADMYNRQGQSAAKQTLNNLNASNMGRNSSYGAAATAQVQAAYAKQAADMIPQLAQQAYDRLVNNYSIAKDIEDTKYNRAITGYNALADYETRQLTDRQLDLNNQAAELELAYLPTTLRQQVESGEITLADARLQLALNQKYSDTDRQLAQEQARAQIANAYRSGSSGSGSLSGTGKVNTKTIDSFVKRFNDKMKTYVNEKGNNYYEMAGVDGDILTGSNGQYVFGNNIGGTRAWNDVLLKEIYNDPYLSVEDMNYLIENLGLKEPEYLTKQYT